MGDIDDVDTIDIKRESHDSTETDDVEIDIGMPRKVPLSPNSPENDSVDLDVENRGVQDPIHIPLAGDDGNFQHTQRFTNFFMEEILKPEFGQKKKYKHTNTDSHDEDMKDSEKSENAQRQILWPAWVYCTRYSDRPSSGPRSRKIRKKSKQADEKRPRTAFTNDQLNRLRKEFEHSRYLTEQKRQELARDLQLTESQIKIWFQNKRAKLKKASGVRNELAMQLMAQGLYNHATIPVGDEK